MSASKREQELRDWAKRVTVLVEKLGSDLHAALAVGVSYATIIRWRHAKSVPHPLARAKIEKLEGGKGQ